MFLRVSGFSVPGFPLSGVRRPVRNSFRLDVGMDLPDAAAAGQLDKAEVGMQLFAGTPVRFGFMIGSSEAEVRDKRAEQRKPGQAAGIVAIGLDYHMVRGGAVHKSAATYQSNCSAACQSQSIPPGAHLQGGAHLPAKLPGHLPV